ncbi:DNA-binding transcriptional ArsR family regulator [Prauserella sediminis]|uniref:DNA-binding transcriptional ArsR family regulator n=1 Tax=Prauserella sediminis TaxID=577680 RepID=A0A839XVG9_9PSEU|nr:helix-turn-helix domain-containing protein [Prauserella sediminis]MBB3663996.1 DNA-binding transcriptional ArsR family regulator [Prauserella sediminis]
MTEDSLDRLRVLAHPLRMRLLSLLTGAAMSSAEAARELGEKQANVSYHLRRLHAAGLVEPAGEAVIRGGRAKRYRHDPASAGPFLDREPEEERILLSALADELTRRSAQRKQGAKYSTTDAEVWVDERVWQRARALAGELGELLHAGAKPPRTPGTHRVSATVALFRLEQR